MVSWRDYGQWWWWRKRECSVEKSEERLNDQIIGLFHPLHREKNHNKKRRTWMEFFLAQVKVGFLS